MQHYFVIWSIKYKNMVTKYLLYMIITMLKWFSKKFEAMESKIK